MNITALSERPAPLYMFDTGASKPTKVDDAFAEAVFQETLKSTLPEFKAIFDARPPSTTEKAVAVLAGHRRDEAWVGSLGQEASLLCLPAPECPPFGELFKPYGAARVLTSNQRGPPPIPKLPPAPKPAPAPAPAPETTEDGKPKRKKAVIPEDPEVAARRARQEAQELLRARSIKSPQELAAERQENSAALRAVQLKAKALKAEYDLFTSGSLDAVDDLHCMTPIAANAGDVSKESLIDAQEKLKSLGRIYHGWNTDYKEKRFTFPENTALLQQLAWFKFIIASDLFDLYKAGLTQKAFKALNPHETRAIPTECEPSPPAGGAEEALKFVEKWRAAMKILMDEVISAARIPAKVVRHEFDDHPVDVRTRALLHDVKRRRVEDDLHTEYVRSVQAAAVADNPPTPHQRPPKPAQPKPAQQLEQPQPQQQPEQQAQPAQP
jgi:hypothetical protein